MEPLLPSSTAGAVDRWRDHRQVIEPITRTHRTGSLWRELPEQFGPWQTPHERLTRWSVDGTLAKLLAHAQADADADAAGDLDWLVAGDSTLVRVHQHGASARRVGGNASAARGDGDGDQEGGRQPRKRRR